MSASSWPCRRCSGRPGCWPRRATPQKSCGPQSPRRAAPPRPGYGLSRRAGGGPPSWKRSWPPPNARGNSGLVSTTGPTGLRSLLRREGCSTVAQQPEGRARFVTVGEVADLLRVSNMTVYRLIQAGALPAVRVGRSYRIREDDVDRYLAGQYTEAG